MQRTMFGWRVGLIHRDGFETSDAAIAAAKQWIADVQGKYGTWIATYSYTATAAECAQ